MPLEAQFNTESCTCILVVIPPTTTKINVHTAWEQIYLFGCIILKIDGEIDVIVSALHGHCRNWRGAKETTKSL